MRRRTRRPACSGVDAAVKPSHVESSIATEGSPPTSAPYTLPMPPSTTAAKIGSSSCEAEVGVEDALHEPGEHAGETGERGPRRSRRRRIDRSTSMPATAASGAIVGEGAHHPAEPVRARKSPTSTIATAATTIAMPCAPESRALPMT